MLMMSSIFPKFVKEIVNRSTSFSKEYLRFLFGEMAIEIEQGTFLHLMYWVTQIFDCQKKSFYLWMLYLGKIDASC